MLYWFVSFDIEVDIVIAIVVVIIAQRNIYLRWWASFRRTIGMSVSRQLAEEEKKRRKQKRRRRLTVS